MAKIDEDLLTPDEKNWPMVIKRYVSMFRKNRGVQAKINTASARDWFRQRVSKDLNHNTEAVHKQFTQWKTRGKTDQGLIGRLFLFAYDAKHKDQLPVWDAWPLVFFFNATVGDGVNWGEEGVVYLHGVNMHYLPPALRLKLFADLIRFKNDSALRDKTRLKLSWQVIKAMESNQLAKHAVKTYRADHIRSQLAEIPPKAWVVVIFMQLARWVKGSKQDAWKGIK
ncbi:DNA end protector protein [Vibrio phage vB_VcorM_GR28A]|nr:DNA end protector protein [Vibrio phage vB_VcorM_GR28A]